MNALKQYLYGGAMICALVLGGGAAPLQNAFAQAPTQQQATSEQQSFKRLIDDIKAQHKPFYNARMTTLSNGM